MSGELIDVIGTLKVLEASGFSLANGAVAQADDATYDKLVDGGGFPHGRFVLSCSFSTTPAENGAISLYARELDVDGAADTQVPEATRPGYFVGSFMVDNTTLRQQIVLTAYDLPLKADFYLHNNGTGQSLDSGWKLTVLPLSRKAAT